MSESPLKAEAHVHLEANSEPQRIEQTHSFLGISTIDYFIKGKVLNILHFSVS